MWGVALLPHPCRAPCSGSLPPLPAPPTLPDLSRAGLPAGPSSVTSARGPCREGTSPGRSRPPRGPGAGVCRPQCEWEPGSPRPARAAAFTTCWKPARASHTRGPHPSARPADPQENEATGRARERNGNAARMPGDPRGPSGTLVARAAPQPDVEAGGLVGPDRGCAREARVRCFLVPKL